MITILPQTSSAKGSAGAVIVSDHKAVATIVTAMNMQPLEQLAVTELKNYIKKITGAELQVVSEGHSLNSPCIYVGPTSAAGKIGLDSVKIQSQEWVVRTDKNDLYLTGGTPYGTLYAVYHFLEDVCGVRWWNAFEEYVPSKPTLSTGALKLSGVPAFELGREIYAPTRIEAARFADRLRLIHTYKQNEDGSYAYIVGAFGQPGLVHTFSSYIPNSEFESHPEWFAEIGGKRTVESRGLCLTNPELQKTMAARLRNYIISTNQAASDNYGLQPRMYSISANDGGSWCQCSRCKAVSDAEGSQAGPLLQLVNYCADSIRKEFPGVYVDTLAYQDSRIPPKHIHPSDNVVIRLCTEPVNMCRPLSDASNKEFYDALMSWSKIAKNLSIWEYDTTYGYGEAFSDLYGNGYGFPVPNVPVFAEDFKLYKTLNVKYIFLQNDSDIGRDMRDLKAWITAKLLENPDQDYQKLLNEFTNGYYGPAGSSVRQYLSELTKAEMRKPSHVWFFAELPEFKYLDSEFLLKADRLFTKAEKSVQNDPVLSRRVRHARLPVDRSILYLWPGLVQEWVLMGKPADTFPLNPDEYMTRYRKTMEEQINLRCTPEGNGLDKSAVQNLVNAATTAFEKNQYIPMPFPQEFSSLPKDRVFQYPAGSVNFHFEAPAKLVKDPDATTGWALKVEQVPISDKVSSTNDTWDPNIGYRVETGIPAGIDKTKPFDFPMNWGVKNKFSGDQIPNGKPIIAENITGPGYHWYKMGSFNIGGNSNIYFFWTRMVRVFFRQSGMHEVWARIKFDGPAFPHGNSSVINSISIDQVVLVSPEKK